MITLADLNKSLGLHDKQERTDSHAYGEVREINEDGTYQVSLNGSDTTTKCARLAGAKVGDTVMVTILKNGYAVVTGCVGGDTDAADAQETAEGAVADAGTAKEIAENTLIYDHTYEVDVQANSVTFTAHLYRGGEDVAAEFPNSQFTWSYKTETEEVPIGTGRVITITNLSEKIGYGLHVIGRFSQIEEQALMTTEYDALTTASGNGLMALSEAVPSGESVRVRDLTVTTTLNSSDLLMVVTPTEEKLASVQTLADAVDKHYVFVQDTPSATWTVTHNLRKFPAVTVIDSAGTEVIGQYTHTDQNTTVLEFSGAFSGKAYFN